MLKNMNHINEIEEQHKPDGKVLNKNIKKEEKKIEKDKNKMIDPIFIFDKKPKNYKKKVNRIGLRKPTEDSKTKDAPIKENNY